MSLNQSRAEKSESHLRKPARSGSSGNQRSFSGAGGKGGGGTAPPPPSSSSSSTNRSFKKSGNGQGGQSRVSAPSVNSESNVAAPRVLQNGAHVQPPLHGSSGVATKPTDSPPPRSTRPVPKAPSSQSTAAASDSMAPTTPSKGDVSRPFALQFGSISPGVMNGMQIPARTSSAPPNLDEQKRDQARHDSFKAVPTLPIPSAPKQQQPRKDASSINLPNTGDSHPSSHAKRDVHAQVPAAPGTTTTQKPSVLPITGMSMQMPFQQPQVPLQFGGPNPQIQSQGITASSLQMPMPLPMGNTAQQQVFVPSLQSHPLQSQGMMHQGQSLSFASQMGHQLPPQLGNMGLGIAPQFAQQQAGKYGGLRKAVKITHPETHEELRLGKRTDSYLDSGSSGPRSHPNMPPQSQPISSFNQAHQVNYYSPMQPNSYNPTMFFQTQTSHPLPSTQMTTGSQAVRFNYPVGQGSQTGSFMNPSALNPVPITKTGPPMPGLAEPLNSEHAHNTHAVAASVPSASVQVTVKPAVGSLGEKVGSSSVTVSSPVASKSELPKYSRPPGEGSTFHSQRDTVISSESSVQQSKSVSEPSGSIPLAVTAKHSTTASAAVSVHRLPPSISSAAPEESGSVVANTESRRKEAIRRSDSFKDQPKKLSRKDLRYSQSQHQTDASDSAGSSKSSSLKMSMEVTKHPENIQASPLEVVESSTSISSLPSWGLEHSCSLKDGNSETVQGKATPTSSETSGGVLGSTEEPLPNVPAGPASEVVSDGVQIGEGSTCEPSNTSGRESEGTVSDNLGAAGHSKQGDCTLQEGLLKQEITRTAEEGKTEPPEGPKQHSRKSEMPTESLESDRQTKQKDSNVEETSIGNESGSVETEPEMNEGQVGCSSEVDRTIDNLIKSATTSSDSIEAETTSSRFLSHDNEKSTADALTTRSERTDCQDVEIREYGTVHPQSTPVPTSICSEVTPKLEGKGTETTSGGPVSTSVSGSKDKPTLEPNRVKSTASKVKKKKKDILKAADAAGSISDLYIAYKGPEEKQETANSSETIESSSSVNVKQEPADDSEKDVVASEEDGQSKVEPDDWEDAADISTPKLETSDIAKQVHGGLMHYGEDGNGFTGKKKYSRDFLLTFSEQCTVLPVGFDIGSDIADALMSVKVGSSHRIDRESHPNSGRIIDRGSGGPRRGSGMVDDDKWSKSPGPFALGRDPAHGGAVAGFRPGQGGNHGVLRIPRGPSSGQHVGGILSGPMQSLVSQGGMQRNSSDADRWQRTGSQKGLIPSPQTPLQIMHKAERKYEVGKVSDKEDSKQRQLKAILNKLTPQNFERLFEQVKDVNIDNMVTLTGVISQIFDKALMEPTFCEMYANFCSRLARDLPDLNEDNEKITFKRLLLNKCQEEFERGEREQAEANRVEEEGEIERSEEEREVKKTQARRRMLGNIRLIGELYKKRMLTERIMHECIKKLLGQYQSPDEEDVEALCKLMSTIGEMIDHPKAKEHMDVYFDMMIKMSNNMTLSSRVRFMLKDAIDLRKNKWQQRRKVEGPKKIEEVHRDAAQERQAQASRQVRGPSISSSARRGQPMDFGPRGSTVLSSPNAQMGGLRGLPPQVRGYGAQDFRMEDRHPYESRTLSVPLPQKPIDDDSITLGPQGGLARGMSIRGQPPMSSVPLADMSPSPGDSRRFASGPNGYSSVSEFTTYNSREELVPRSMPERFVGMPAYEQSNSHERPYFGNQDLRNSDRSVDRSMATSPSTRVQGSSTVVQNVASEKVWPEERLRDMSISTIREFYSAKDEKEVALCIKDLNSPSFYPSMISIWVTDSFERKDMERDLLAKLLINLTKSRDRLLSQIQLIKGFESVLCTLEDAVNDAPKAAEFLGRILAKVIIENVIPLKDIGKLIHEGGEEPGRLREIGLASEVLGSILEIIRLEKGESVLNEIRRSSNMRLEDFRPPDPINSRKLDAFI